MRKCALFSVAPLVALSFLVPAQLSAQSVFLGAGAGFPTGDYADFGDGDGANTGFLAIGGVTFPVSEGRFSVLGEGFFGSNSHDYEDDKTNLYGAMAGLLFDTSGEGEAGIYAYGQAGLMVHSYKSDSFEEDSETGFAFGGGAGYGFPLGGLNGWVEGRYMQGLFDDGNTTFFGVLAGLSFPLGGDN
jgi:hypothetical protein